MSELPNEMWNQILTFVPPPDLCQFALVARSFQSLSSDPSLWQDAKISKAKLSTCGIRPLLAIKRFKCLKSLSLSKTQLPASDYNALFNHICLLHACLKLKHLDLSQELNFKSISPHLLSQSLSHLKTVDLSSSGITRDQVMKLLEILSTCPTSLEEFKLNDVILNGWRLSHIPSKLLAQAASNLTTIELRKNGLRATQMEDILKASTISTTLARVDIGENDASQVSEDVIFEATLKLNSLGLGDAQLSPEQTVSVLTAGMSSSSLQQIDLERNCYLRNCYLSVLHHTMVPPDIIGAFVSKLRKVNFSQTGLTLTNEICQAISASETLNDLNLSGCDLGHCSPSALGKVVENVGKLNLHYTRLTSEHCASVLLAVMKSSKVRSLDIGKNDMSQVPPDLIKCVAAKIKLEMESCNVDNQSIMNIVM